MSSPTTSVVLLLSQRTRWHTPPDLKVESGIRMVSRHSIGELAEGTTSIADRVGLDVHETGECLKVR